MINKRKGIVGKGSPRLKKSKKGEVHYCPDPPAGLTAKELEEKRLMLEVHPTEAACMLD